MVYNDLFNLNKDYEYFNASYGLVPKSVSFFHHKMLLDCESNPYKWFTQNYKRKVIQTKKKLAPYLNADVSDFVIVDNSSSAANSIFNSLTFTSKSVILVLDTAYGLIDKLINKMVILYKCKIEIIPVNIYDINLIKYDIVHKIDEVYQKGLKVELICLDHISSCPGMLIPVCDIGKECKKYDIPILVDGAHALGQVEINLQSFYDSGISYWFTDTHKWFFSPKGSAVLWVAKKKQNNIYPTIDCAAICSKGCTVIQKCNSSEDLSDQSNFENRFLYLGTKDYTPWISISAAIDFIEDIGGYKFLINRNRDLCLWAQYYMSKKLHTNTIPDILTCSMCNIHLPFIDSQESSTKLMKHLMSKNIYVVICEYPKKMFWLRVCIQLFIDESSIEYLTESLIYYISIYHKTYLDMIIQFSIDEHNSNM